MVQLEFYTEDFSGIPSVNEMFHPRIGKSSSGKLFSTVRKDRGVSDFQERLKWCFLPQRRGIQLPPKKDLSRIVSYYVFGFTNTSYLKRDVTNCIKAVEDALLGRKKKKGCPLLPYDDSMVSMCAERKVIASKPFIYVKLALVQIQDKEEDDRAILCRFFTEGKL